MTISECLVLQVGNIAFNNTENPYKIISCQDSAIGRHIHILSRVMDIVIHLPLKDYMNGKFIMPIAQDRAKLSVYPSLQNAIDNQNEHIEIDGIVLLARQSRNGNDKNSISFELKIGDKTALIEKQYMDASQTISDTGFNKHLRTVLSQNGFDDVVKNIIPARSGISFVGDSVDVKTQGFDDITLNQTNQKTISPNQTVGNYLEALCNEAQVMLTTNIYKGKEYLYCLDTSQVAIGYARQDYNKAGFGNKIQTINDNYNTDNQYPIIIDTDFQIDFMKIYNTIDIHQQHNSQNYGELGEITTVKLTEKVSKIGYEITKNQLLKLRFSFEMRENRNGLATNDYGEYLIRQLMAQHMFLIYTVKGFFCNQNQDLSKLIRWQFAAPITINSDILERNPTFSNQAMYRAKDKWILAGYTLSYDVENGLRTKLYILPNSFPFTEKR
jgi:hypothetical protein